MSQAVFVEALAQEIYEAIDKYGQEMPIAVAVGVLECVKLQLIFEAREEPNDLQ